MAQVGLEIASNPLQGYRHTVKPERAIAADSDEQLLLRIWARASRWIQEDSRDGRTCYDRTTEGPRSWIRFYGPREATRDRQSRRARRPRAGHGPRVEQR